MVVCATRCCLWCLDTCVKFINKTAYIQIALHSKSFCNAAWQSFYLTIRHLGRVSASGMVGWLLALLGKGFIIALNVWITTLFLKAYDVRTQPVFAVIVGVIAYIISTLFLTLFEFAGLTILHCFIFDEDVGGGARTPDSLKPYLKMNEDEKGEDDGSIPPRKNSVSQSKDKGANVMD